MPLMFERNQFLAAHAFEDAAKTFQPFDSFGDHLGISGRVRRHDLAHRAAVLGDQKRFTLPP